MKHQSKKATGKKISHSDNEVYNEVVLISKQICYFLIQCRATERPLKSKEEVYFSFILSINAIDPFQKINHKTTASKRLMLLDKP